jgi:hypothetical protein
MSSLGLYEPSGTRPRTFRFVTSERDAIYGHAARQAAIAAEHVRRCAYRNPAAAADAAWAASDALHIAAHATNNRALRRAANAYDRAARAPFGRIPWRTGSADRLRTAARVMALIGGGSRDDPSTAAALIANLIALVLAVADLRQAQQHAAQAAAARSAAEQLHTAARQMRTVVRAETARVARSANAAYLASHDFLAPPLHCQPEQALRASARPGPLYDHQPPIRVSPGR